MHIIIRGDALIHCRREFMRKKRAIDKTNRATCQASKVKPCPAVLVRIPPLATVGICGRFT